MTFRPAIIGLQTFVFVLFAFSSKTFAQIRSAPKVEPENFSWGYVVLLVLGIALAAAVGVWLKKRKAVQKENENAAKNKKENSNESSHTFDANEEMEWLRKNQNIVDRKRKKNVNRTGSSKSTENSVKNGSTTIEAASDIFDASSLDVGEPPIFELKEIEMVTAYSPLPLSSDGALLSAIEQTQDEYEEDEEVRDLALRILMAFRTRNSIEALSQVAIYDLSSSLRSKAVSILSEFDHETVFEAIVLACADPSREVRAAAARAFSRLSFDRADAWARIIETNEQGRMIHAARAAIEGGFVERSFDRLIHRDAKYAYEAFVLVTLLIKAGELDLIFEMLRNHGDTQVKRAVIHVLSVTKNENSLTVLYTVLEDKQLSAKFKEDIDKAIAENNLVTA